MPTQPTKVVSSIDMYRLCHLKFEKRKNHENYEKLSHSLTLPRTPLLLVLKIQGVVRILGFVEVGCLEGYELMLILGTVHSKLRH